LLRHRVHVRIALVCAAALTLGLGGCKNSAGVLQDNNEGGWFSKPLDVFAKPDWARPADNKNVQLSPNAPVGPDDLVGADGSCAAAAAPAQTGAVPAAGETPATARAAVEPGQGLEPGNAPLIGGIALGMTECDAVRRAGMATNVSIGADEKGERKTVLTYLTGNWPGIYTFNSGRLKVVDRAPEPPKPAKPAPKKKPKTAAQQ
jgi:hypothetical protein